MTLEESLCECYGHGQNDLKMTQECTYCTFSWELQFFNANKPRMTQFNFVSLYKLCVFSDGLFCITCCNQELILILNGQMIAACTTAYNKAVNGAWKVHNLQIIFPTKHKSS